MFASILTATLTTVIVSQATPTFEQRVKPALDVAGLSVASARFDPGVMSLFRQGEFATPLYLVASENPWRMPFLVDVMTADMAANAGKPSDILNAGARAIGVASRRTLIGNPIQAQVEASKKPGALKDAIARIVARSGGRQVAPDVSSLPPQVQEAAALILAVLESAYSFRQLAFGSPSTAETLRRIAVRNLDEISNEEFAARLGLYRSFNVKHLLAGGHDLALATQEAAKLLVSVPVADKFKFELDTNWGQLSLSGGSNDTYSKPSLLIIDTSGDDRYIGAPCALGKQWASISIDVHGKDSYVSEDRRDNTPVETWPSRKLPATEQMPGPAWGCGGYAMLFDLDGDDIYRSAAQGIGAGRFGVGVLHDGGGNDIYDGYADSVGFGMFGVGIIEDLGGDDTYAGFNQVQGVGQTLGFGAIVDRGGNDNYVANTTVIDFPSAQSDKHNTGMAQGAGNGTRRDYIDAHSLAGGFGLLLDTAGDDSYRGSVFVQGVGYWEGVGVLKDMAGNDKYEGAWYAQGASAHFAIGYVQDSAGNDNYVATMNMAQGAGHDFGTGYLLDLTGDDSYKAPNLSLGAGNANGFGVLWESAGDDRYESSGLTLGKSGESPPSGLRTRALTLGLFLDAGGTDTYPAAASWAGDGRSGVNWTGQRAEVVESQLGIFFDQR